MADTKLRKPLSPLDAPWQARGDGASDDTQALAAFFAALPNACDVDLGGRQFAVYGDVPGATDGDALRLDATLRIAGKSNVTLRNGTIFVKQPGRSRTKCRFPSTLAIDGCSNIRLENLTLRGKGESWGDADAGAKINPEGRRNFLVQNGGHALVIIRSQGVEARQCTFELAGSVSPCYVTSSNDVRLLGCYSSPQSLGYAAYAVDSWCGNAAVSGYDRHETVLENCRTDAGGARFGSKAGVAAEDADVVVHVNGGAFKDAYANGGAHFLGAAFVVSSAAMSVKGAVVENCAGVGLTYHSGNNLASFECDGVTASGLRTFMHANAANHFGTSKIIYRECRATFAKEAAVWGENELSAQTVIANMKVASPITVDLIRCDIRGAKYLSWNTNACYGGIRIDGGHYEVDEEIFCSAGWGGSRAGSGRGFEILGDTTIILNSTTASQPVSNIANRDAKGVQTYLFVDVDDKVTIQCRRFRLAESVSDASGGKLLEKKRLNARLVGCGSSNLRSDAGSVMRVVSLDGAGDGAYRLTVSWPIGVAVLGWTWDDNGAARRLLALESPLKVNGKELRAQVRVSDLAGSFTVGRMYTVVSA